MAFKLSRWSGRVASLAVLAALVASTGGCYERVIKAKGFGADQMNVQKPYASDTAIDNALMGPIPDSSGERKIKGSRW